ncbi:MAG: hypothetical protein H6970_15455 [Gammaproteobacteria bacterium]|nr:hypothetical protein [Gammaproteobacteria bacterium]
MAMTQIVPATLRHDCAPNSLNDVRVKSLADTGALLALLDRNDRWHAACVNAFQQFHLPLLTSTAVPTELFRPIGYFAHALCAT